MSAWFLYILIAVSVLLLAAMYNDRCRLRAYGNLQYAEACFLQEYEAVHRFRCSQEKGESGVFRTELSGECSETLTISYETESGKVTDYSVVRRKESGITFPESGLSD